MNTENLQDINILKEKFEYIYISKSEYETKNLAKYIASKLKNNDIIALNGELGAGKTTFMQGIANFFDIESQISSPTFTIVNEYTLKDGNYIYHFDVYLEIYIPGIKNAGNNRSNHMDICSHQNCNMHVPTE